MRPLGFRVRVPFAFFVAGLLSIATASTALAQQAPAPAAAAPPAAAWHGGVTFSTSITAGVTKQSMVVLDAQVARLGGGWSWTLIGETTYGKVKLGALEQKISDSDTVRLLAERDITPRTFVALQPAYTRNAIQAIDYHYEELAGLGVRAIKHPRGTLTLMGGGGVVQDDKNVPSADGTSGVLAAVQSASAIIALDARKQPMWNWTERLVYVHDLQKAKDDRLDFKTSLVGRIAGPLALNITYQIVHEEVVATGNQQDDQRFSIGVSWQR